MSKVNRNYEREIYCQLRIFLENLEAGWHNAGPNDAIKLDHMSINHIIDLRNYMEENYNLDSICKQTGCRCGALK